MSDLKPGIYRHYKGNEYRVIGVAQHSETAASLVVYEPMYGKRSLWVRPLAMFVEKVYVDGHSQQRFKYVGS